MDPSKSDSKPQICAVIPCFNESENLNEVLSHLKEYVSTIICVDDCSSDETSRIIERHGVINLRHCINLGQGAALATGFRFVLAKTSADVIITLDGDGQHDPSEIPALVNHLLSNNHQIVFGTRFASHRLEAPLVKRVVLKFATWITNLVTGLNLTDTHNGLRAIVRDRLSYVTPTQRGMAHATEIVHLVGKHGLRYSEFPVNVRYNTRKSGGGQSILNALNILWDLIWR